MKSKNYSIEFYRIIATLIICIHHMQEKCGLNLISDGFLLVDFFFIISGLFLSRTFYYEKTHSGSKYFFRRIKRLYPEYIFAAIVAIFSYGYIGKFEFTKAIPELFMAQNWGMFSGGYNYPCWYLSVLIVASFILYQCLRYGKDIFIKVISPLFIMCGYAYIVKNYQAPNFVWSTSGCIHIPFLRCLCGMIIGIIIFYASQCDFVEKINPVIGTIAETLCIIVIALGLLSDISSVSITVSAMAVLIFITYTQKGILSKKVLNQKIFYNMSKYSYSVYLSHGIFANVFDTLNNSFFHFGKVLLPIYLISVIIYAVIVYNFISLISKKMKKR